MWVGGKYNIQPYIFVSALFIIYANAIIDQRTQLNNSPDIALTVDDFAAQDEGRGGRGSGEIVRASPALNNLRRKIDLRVRIIP